MARKRQYVTLVLLASAVSNCTTDRERDQSAVDQARTVISLDSESGVANPAQLVAAEGGVTEAEYRAGFQKFAACMTEAGYPLESVGPNPNYPWLIYAEIPGAAVESGVEDTCYRSNFMSLDMLWQAQAEDAIRINPQMDPDWQYFSECAERLGVDVGDARSAGDIVDALMAADKFAECPNA